MVRCSLVSQRPALDTALDRSVRHWLTLSTNILALLGRCPSQHPHRIQVVSPPLLQSPRERKLREPKHDHDDRSSLFVLTVTKTTLQGITSVGAYFPEHPQATDAEYQTSLQYPASRIIKSDIHRTRRSKLRPCAGGCSALGSPAISYHTMKLDRRSTHLRPGDNSLRGPSVSDGGRCQHVGVPG